MWLVIGGLIGVMLFEWESRRFCMRVGILVVILFVFLWLIGFGVFFVFFWRMGLRCVVFLSSMYLVGEVLFLVWSVSICLRSFVRRMIWFSFFIVIWLMILFIVLVRVILSC